MIENVLGDDENGRVSLQERSLIRLAQGQQFWRWLCRTGIT